MTTHQHQWKAGDAAVLVSGNNNRVECRLAKRTPHYWRVVWSTGRTSTVWPGRLDIPTPSELSQINAMIPPKGKDSRR